MARRDEVTRTAHEHGDTSGSHGDYARGVNVSDGERLLSVLGGTMLGLYGLGRIVSRRIAAIGEDLEAGAAVASEDVCVCVGGREVDGRQGRGQTRF